MNRPRYLRSPHANIKGERSFDCVSATNSLARALAILFASSGCELNNPRDLNTTPQVSAVATPEQGSRSAPSPWVKVVPATDPSLTQIPAEVVGDASSHTAIAMPYPCKILAIDTRLGSPVEAGDVLIEVMVPEVVQAVAAITAANEQIELQQDRLAHLQPLKGQGLVGGRDLFDLEVRIAELKADRLHAAAVMTASGVSARGGELDRGRIKLRAPADGIVTSIEAVVGEIHDPSAGPMLTLTAESFARIEVHAMQPIPGGAELEFEAVDGRTVALRSDPTSTVVEPADGSLRLWYAPVTAVRLPPSLRGHVHVRSLPQDTVQIPSRAVAWHDGHMVVFKRNAQNADPVEVELVSRSGASALVRGQLQVGDEIAADGSVWTHSGEGGE